MVLTAAELTLMRAELEETLPDTCSLSRPTRVTNDSGGWSDTYATVATVACRIAPLIGREEVIAGRQESDADHVISLPALTDVRSADRVVSAGRTFEVMDIRTRSEELVRRVTAREAVA